MVTTFRQNVATGGGGPKSIVAGCLKGYGDSRGVVLPGGRCGL